MNVENCDVQSITVMDNTNNGGDTNVRRLLLFYKPWYLVSSECFQGSVCDSPKPSRERRQSTRPRLPTIRYPNCRNYPVTMNKSQTSSKALPSDHRNAPLPPAPINLPESLVCAATVHPTNSRYPLITQAARTTAPNTDCQKHIHARV
jgi:hypothetical protein